MKFKFIDAIINYDGSQLKSLYAYTNHELLGDSILAFTGACDIPFENMVDEEDVLARSAIRSQNMLHFIIEEFNPNLELAVTRQRLFASLTLEELSKLLPEKKFHRDGDDIYLDDAKLSISIATVSPVSSLIHFAMNITTENTPVKTVGLKDLGISAKPLAESIGNRYVQEMKTIREACCKVHWVR